MSEDTTQTLDSVNLHGTASSLLPWQLSTPTAIGIPAPNASFMTGLRASQSLVVNDMLRAERFQPGIDSSLPFLTSLCSDVMSLIAWVSPPLVPDGAHDLYVDDGCPRGHTSAQAGYIHSMPMGFICISSPQSCGLAHPYPLIVVLHRCVYPCKRPKKHQQIIQAV